MAAVAIELDGDSAEVECYGTASSTQDEDTLSVLRGRCLKQCDQVDTEWRMLRGDYIPDHHFSAVMPTLGGTMVDLQLGTGLDSNHPLFRLLYTSPSD